MHNERPDPIVFPMTPLFSLHIVASPEYLAKRGVPQKMTDLSQHQLIGFTGAKVLNNWPITGGDNIVANLTASNGETVRQLTLAGNGIACLSGFMVNKDIAEGRLMVLLDQQKQLNTDREQVNAVFYRSSAIARRISAFIDFIQPRLTL